ncbi:MAG TPA: hypothetical protein VGF67_16690 [Ktedonobacteraceae bacterium]
MRIGQHIIEMPPGTLLAHRPDGWGPPGCILPATTSDCRLFPGNGRGEPAALQNLTNDTGVG